MAVMDRPWDWGTADCCASACDVFQRLHGIDPMAPLRGRYKTKVEAEAMMAAYGGLDVLAARLAVASMLRDSDGREGDIGVSGPRVASGGRCLMIHVGAGWAAKTSRGFAVLQRAERAWSA